MFGTTLHFLDIEEQIIHSKEETIEGLVKRAEIRDSGETVEDESEERRERMRIESVTELLLSERYYVRDLETIVHVRS